MTVRLQSLYGVPRQLRQWLPGDRDPDHWRSTQCRHRPFRQYLFHRCERSSGSKRSREQLCWICLRHSWSRHSDTPRRYFANPREWRTLWKMRSVVENRASRESRLQIGEITCGRLLHLRADGDGRRTRRDRPAPEANQVPEQV
jgi:hypothetical protein